MATLTITNPSLRTGDVLSLYFSGFMHGDDVWIGVVGGGGLYVTADGTGHGAAAFALGESPGTYTLEAYDSIGNYATASFTVLSSGTGTPWTLLSTVNTLASHNIPAPIQTWVLLSTINTQAIHSANLIGWVLLSTVSTQAIQSANLLGWVLLNTANVSVIHTANLIGWVLLSTVNTTASHKTSGTTLPPSGTTPSWLIPVAIVAVALANQQSTKKVGAH